jgi:RNA polymerase sigma-70 factor, ECF subfamily
VALAQLTEEDCEILQLAAWEELAPAQIAVVLGVRSVTARSRLHRARRRLRAQLDAVESEPPPAAPPLAMRVSAAWRTPAAASPHRPGRTPEHPDLAKETTR